MESTNLKPKFGRVLIKREVKKSNGLIIPESAAKRNAPSEGVIIALGENAGWTESFTEDAQPKIVQSLKVGDHVIFGQHAGAWLKSEGSTEENLFICADEDILAVKEQA